METVFTFWEGTMPDYIKLCMKTWEFDYTVLNYSNVRDYIDIPLDKLQTFTLPQIADVIRVHVLRDYGGYWLDTDTIMLGELPKENICGYVKDRTNTIGFLHTELHSDMFTEWVEYQDHVIENQDHIPYVHNWNIFGNKFTDDYVKLHEEIKIHDITNCWPEVYKVNVRSSRAYKYKALYFTYNLHLKDFNKTNMLMLHNSWTPDWYKRLSEKDVLKQQCTLSNILREVAR